jgi:hypothetical protein
LKEKIKDMKKTIPIYDSLPGAVRDSFLRIATREYETFAKEEGKKELTITQYAARSGNYKHLLK